MMRKQWYSVMLAGAVAMAAPAGDAAAYPSYWIPPQPKDCSAHNTQCALAYGRCMDDAWNQPGDFSAKAAECRAEKKRCEDACSGGDQPRIRPAPLYVPVCDELLC